jgi:hypothetical protein
MKNKARADGLTSSKTAAPARASPSKINVTTSTEKTTQNVGAQLKQDTPSLVSGRPKSKVLCSDIADKLKIEQN